MLRFKCTTEHTWLEIDNGLPDVIKKFMSMKGKILFSDQYYESSKGYGWIPSSVRVVHLFARMAYLRLMSCQMS